MPPKKKRKPPNVKSYNQLTLVLAMKNALRPGILLFGLLRFVGAYGTITAKDECRRRMVLSKSLAIMAGLGVGVVPTDALAEQTVGKDPKCNDANCLGVWDGLLADCPHGPRGSLLKGGAGCTASQDDTPGIFAEPWDFSESNSLDWEYQSRLLLPAIQLVTSKRRDQVDILLQRDRYLRVLFTDGKSFEKSMGEFYFTPNDTTVQFRIATLQAVSSPFSSSLSNQERAELIRKEMRYLKLPVLRNRRRTFFFGESEFDTFGPGSAALGPPAEMTTGELEGRQDVDPKLKIDILEKFPTAK